MCGLVRKELDGSVYWTGGTGEETLVLLHGINDQAGTWAPVIAALAQRYRLIVPDLPGHGESEPRNGSIAISNVVVHVASILDHEDARDFILAGNSFGAWMAILYTLAHRDRVKRLFLESGGGLAIPLAVPLIAQDRDTAVMILQAIYGRNYVPQDWAIDGLLARAADAPILRLTELREHLVDNKLVAIDVPTTLIWGEQDGVLPLTYARTLQGKIAGAKLEIIEGAAHIPHLQQPQRFLACLTATS